MSIHAQPTAKVLLTRDGQRHEFTTAVDPNRYLPIYLSMAGWLQEVSLDTVTNFWHMAHKLRNEKEFELARQDAARARRFGTA